MGSSDGTRHCARCSNLLISRLCHPFVFSAVCSFLVLSRISNVSPTKGFQNGAESSRTTTAMSLDFQVCGEINDSDANSSGVSNADNPRRPTPVATVGEKDLLRRKLQGKFKFKSYGD